MRSRVRKHLSFANVAAFTALMVALGGTSIAATEAFKDDVKEALGDKGVERKLLDELKKEIESKHIANGAVKGADVKNGLPGGKLADGTLKEDKLTHGDRPYWIQVGSAGETQAQSGGIEATRLQQGEYAVTFPVGMSTHGITANRETRDIANQGSDYTIVITRCGGGPAGAECAPERNNPRVVIVRMDKVGNNPDVGATTLDDAGFILSATP